MSQPGALQPVGNAAADFAQTSAASTAARPASGSLTFAVPGDAAYPPFLFVTSPEFAAPIGRSELAARNAFGTLALFAAPAAAPQNPPEPHYYYGGPPVRLEVSLGFAVVRFRSSVYTATAPGLNTAVAYFFNEWFGVEGAVTSAIAPTIYLNEHVKYIGYGGGPRFVKRGGPLEPWGHVLFGGAHILPQTAFGGRNAFEVQAGGGGDYPLNLHWVLRIEADYLRTQFFGTSQNSGQAILGFAYRF